MGAACFNELKWVLRCLLLSAIRLFIANFQFVNFFLRYYRDFHYDCCLTSNYRNYTCGYCEPIICRCGWCVVHGIRHKFKYRVLPMSQHSIVTRMVSPPTRDARGWCLCCHGKAQLGTALPCQSKRSFLVLSGCLWSLWLVYWEKPVLHRELWSLGWRLPNPPGLTAQATIDIPSPTPASTSLQTAPPTT